MFIRERQSGFTLLELMIALAISVIVMAGVLALFINMINHSRGTIDAGRLDRELHSVLTAMGTDIRRAGYWGQAETSNSNPFMVTGSTDLSINGANDCILVTYDHDDDGVLPAISAGVDDERYGYRKTGDAIQFRPRGSTFDCTATAANWSDLTDPNVVTITAFNIVKNEDDIDLDGAGPGTEKMTVRSITITITGQLTNDASVTKTYTQTVRVYNDKYTP